MPNINLLQTITTATDQQSYFILSDQGLARRFSYGQLVSQLEATLPATLKTDQNLFTTTDVTFRSVTVQDRAPDSNGESQHGFQTDFYHSDGTALQTNDGIGSLRFGGFDGNEDIVQGEKIPSVAFAGFASENWANNGTKTTAAGAGWFIYHQPNNTQLSINSKVRNIIVTSTSTGNPALPSLNIIQIGAMSNTPMDINTTTDGVHTFMGPGRAQVSFVNSQLVQYGLPTQDNTAPNATLTSTNAYIFVTSRSNTYNGFKQPLAHQDTVGYIGFNGINQTDASNNGVNVASIQVHASSDYSGTQAGSEMVFYTMSSATYTSSTIRSLVLEPTENHYNSDLHIISNSNQSHIATLSTSTATILGYQLDNTGLKFPDTSVQTTAFTATSYISKATLQAVVAASTSFSDFQARIASL